MGTFIAALKLFFIPHIVLMSISNGDNYMSSAAKGNKERRRARVHTAVFKIGELNEDIIRHFLHHAAVRKHDYGQEGSKRTITP